MTRRRFLALLGLAPVAVPAALRALAAAPAVTNPIFSGELGVWKGIAWHDATFDYSNRVGFALGTIWDGLPAFRPGDDPIIVVRPARLGR